jgi:hypothetical protein
VRQRDRVMSYLKAVGEVSDQGGLASTALAEAVGYPGSSLAFAQLLSAMERSGLIEREVRGRRTYRITPAPAAVVAREADRPARRGGTGVPKPGPEPDADLGLEPSADLGLEPDADLGLDYDELARRLLIEVLHRLAVAPSGGDLAKTVASLERKLARVEAQQRALRAENSRLREQLAATRQSLAVQSRAAAGDTAAVRDTAAGDTVGGDTGVGDTAVGDTGAYLNRLDTGAVQLLERLLASLRGEPERGQSAEAG